MRTFHKRYNYMILITNRLPGNDFYTNKSIENYSRGFDKLQQPYVFNNNMF